MNRSRGPGDPVHPPEDRERRSGSGREAAAEGPRDLAARLEASEREREVAAREAQRLAGELARREAEIARLEAEIAAIHASRLWRIGHGYWSLLRRLRGGRGPAGPAAPAPGGEAGTREAPAAPEGLPLAELPREGCHEVVCLPASDWDSSPRSQRLMLRFARRGHRVFFLACNFRRDGEPYRLRPLAENIWEVSLRGAARHAGAGPSADEEQEQLLAGLDALRRGLSLGATASVVELPSWESLAAAAWRRFAWPVVHAGSGEPAGHDDDLASRVREAFPKVSIVIVTIDNLEINRLCLESLYARTEWPSFEVVVVDNASTDGTVEYLAEARERWRSLHVLLNDRNLGFAAATNQGLRKASGEYLVLLNNDTVLCRGWLTALVRHLHARPQIGLIGPVSNAVANEARVEVGYGDVADMPRWAAAHVREHDGELVPLPMLGMFCLALRRETFERIGPLDERFGIGMFEDDDYSRRAKLLGYEVACARDSFVHHWQRASFRRLGEREYLRLFEENRRKYEEKWQEEWTLIGPLEDQRRQLRGVLGRIRARRGAVVFLPASGRDVHLARAWTSLGYVAIFDRRGGDDPSLGFEEVEPDLFRFRGEPPFLRWIPAPILWTSPGDFHLAGEYAPDAITVYDWSADLSVLPGGRELLEANHRRALAEATLVISAQRPLHAQALAVRPDALYLPGAVDQDLEPLLVRLALPAAPTGPPL